MSRNESTVVVGFRVAVDGSSPPVVRQYAKGNRKQPKSSKGQQPLIEGTGKSATGAGSQKYREELHPRNEAGEYASKGGGNGSGAKPPQHGQKYLFSELAAKLHALEDIDDSPKAAAKQQEIWNLLAGSDVPQEQLEALLSGDRGKLEELKAAGEAEGSESDEPEDFSLAKEPVVIGRGNVGPGPEQAAAEAVKEGEKVESLPGQKELIKP